MKTSWGHLTYCTNIHAGESWTDHFTALKENIPLIKKAFSPEEDFGIGLRLSHLASLELGEKTNLRDFKKWLDDSGCYVFTMNGFPYGGFHHTKVKDLVHKPDWTTQDRVLYTMQLFNLLANILPENISSGGISTSPLSYKHWHRHEQAETDLVFQETTENILKVVKLLIGLKNTTGKVLHLDIEPEPDGLVENGPEFMDWYATYLLPRGIAFLADQLDLKEDDAENAIREHVRLCYDICHFAVGYEDHAQVIRQLQEHRIQIGKIQISAAVKAPMAIVPAERSAVIDAFKKFDESTYLHQVVAMQQGNVLKRYRDLPQALHDASNAFTREWRSHFHVPLFVHDYGVLKSTQDDIKEVLAIQRKDRLTDHLEVETYTWEVLPQDLKLPLHESITRELQWVKDELKKEE